MLFCSLLNYAVFQGAFYCKVCSKLLAEGIGAPNSTLSPNHQQLLLKDARPNPRQESQTKSGPTGRILAREKMPRKPSNLHLQGNQSDKVTSQDKPKTICSPLKKDAKNYTGRKHERYGTKERRPQDSTMILHSPRRSGGSYYKTWEDNSLSESFGKQRSQLPRVVGPKCGDRVLHWLKKVHGSQELGALENRQLHVDEGIAGVQVGKTGSSILEKARRFQPNTSEVERSISKVTSLSLKHPRSSLGGLFISSEGALRHTTVTPIATTPGAPQLAEDHFQSKKPGGDSSWKVTADGKNPRQRVQPLPKVRTTLPALVSPLEQRSKKKLPKASQKNTLDTLEIKAAEQPSDNTLASMKNEKPSQTKLEGLVSSPDHEENDQIEHAETTLAFSVDPGKSCLKTNQEPKPSWMSRNEFLEEVTEILQPEKRPSMDNQLTPETLTLNEEDKKDEMHPRAISDTCVTLTCFSVSLDTEAKGRTSSLAIVENIEDGSSLSSSQADDAEHREVLPRNSLQEHAPSICNPEPTPEITNTNEKLQSKASSGPNLGLAFQKDTSRGSSLLSSAKDAEIYPSWEVPHLIEKQEIGHVTMEIKAQPENIAEASQDIIAKPSRKQPLKKQNNPFAQFFASKTRRSIPSQKPISGAKKAVKTHSALLTLFGHSVSKDKSQKEWPRKELGELSGKVNIQSTHFSSLPKPDFSKKDENSGVVHQTRNSEAGPQDSKESHGVGSKGNQNRNSPPLDSVNTVSLKLGREISTPTRMQSRSKPLEILRQSNIHTEHATEEPEKSFSSFQSCVMSTENMSQCFANTSVEKSVSCRNAPSEQELDNVDSQDLEIKARNVSLLHPFAKGDTQALEEENWVPDRLPSFKGMEESASMEKENTESSSPGSDIEPVPMKDHFCSGSSENFLALSRPQFAELEPNMMIKQDRNKQPPESGNFQALGSNSDHPFELTLHDEQATNGNYSIEENHFHFHSHSVLIPAQSMPELLRDTLQSKATERPAEDKNPLEDQIQASESRRPQEQLL